MRSLLFFLFLCCAGTLLRSIMAPDVPERGIAGRPFRDYAALQADVNDFSQASWTKPK